MRYIALLFLAALLAASSAYADDPGNLRVAVYERGTLMCAVRGVGDNLRSEVCCPTSSQVVAVRYTYLRDNGNSTARVLYVATCEAKEPEKVSALQN